MEKLVTGQIASMDQFVDNWNAFFQDFPITVDTLKNSHGMTQAVLKVFSKLGIDSDAVLQPPPEENRNEHMVYFWDLIPIINMSRIVKFFMPKFGIKFTFIQFLQPITKNTYSILLILFNLVLFCEQRLEEIAPAERELFLQSEKVKILEDRINKLQVLLNEQAHEKAKRAERLEIIASEQKKLEEELKHEKEAHDVIKKELEIILNENKQMEIILEQKKTHRDGLIAEVEKLRGQRVYDAEDIKAQVEQATHNVQEAEDKLTSLRATLMQKENCLKNLQAIKPNLTLANNLLHEIMNLTDSLNNYDSDDLDSDSKEGELKVFNTELTELETKLEELRAARAEAANKRQENQVKRQQEKTAALTNLRKAEAMEKEYREQAKKAKQQIEEIKQHTIKYEAEKSEGMEELAKLKYTFTNELKSVEDAMIKKIMEAQKMIEERLRNHRS
ncbi:PREDICTED: kinectin-like [Papilio xuthus]|uniref:Kinectin-like n=1 Tax=Papilio xuthus TaxID=66420 RepID=A0AAJ7EHL0_PAPXU|nr:PREDICTED: kinectin-like [Papilio xuthus]